MYLIINDQLFQLLIFTSTVAQRKMSVVSSRRMSSVMSLRKRESNASQLGGLITQDGQNRLSLPPVLTNNIDNRLLPHVYQMVMH